MNPLEQLRAENPQIRPGTDALSAMRSWNSDKVPGYAGYAQSQEYRNAEYVRQAEKDQMRWYHKTFSTTKAEYDNFIQSFAEGMVQTPRVEEKSFNPWTANKRGAVIARDSIREALDDLTVRWGEVVDSYSKDGLMAGLNPLENRLDKEAALTRLAVGGVNVAASPIMAATTYVSAYPGIGHVADGINSIFMGAMSGTGQVASDALWGLPFLSDEAKQKLDAPVRELTGLASSVGLGSVFVPKGTPPVITKKLPVQGEKVSYPVEIERTSYEPYTRPEDMPVIDYGESKPVNPDAVTDVVPDATPQAPSDLPVIDAGTAARAKEIIAEIQETVKNDPVLLSELDSLQKSLEGEIAVETGRLTRLRQYPDFDRVESEVLAQLEMSEAGQRIITESGEVVVQRSTFPDFLPKDEYKITKNDVDKAIKLLEEGAEPRAGATKQQAILDSIVSEIERRIDTSLPPTDVSMSTNMPRAGGDSVVGTTPKRPVAEEVGGVTDGPAVSSDSLLRPLSGTGKVAVPAMTQRMREIAGSIDPALAEIQVGATRKRINLKIQAEMAAKLVETDPARAMEISFGRKQPPNAGEFGPEPLVESIVREAMIKKAIKDGDIDTMFALSTLENPRALAEIRHGQEIAALRGRDAKNNPTVVAKEVRTERMEAFEKETGKDAMSAIDAVKKELDDAAYKGIENKKAIDDYLKGLEC